ncbi:MAG: hypothetical protein R3362_07420, partial [Rhodothermales bacterium]|nr:hypothetical protein [Rhodothermales bacterium]
MVHRDLFSLALLLLAVAPAGAQDGWSFTDGPTPSHATALAVTADGAVYAGTYEGVRRSDDGGATWTLAITHPYAHLAQALAVVPGQHVFVGIGQEDFFEPENVHGVVRVYPFEGSSTPSYPSGAWGAAGTAVRDVVAAADGRGWAA